MNDSRDVQNIADDEKSYGLTAIVLVYNGEPYLEDCLNSLVNQTLDNLEILLINDVSTDNSLSICKKFEKNYDNVRLIDKDINEGLGANANLGIKMARGEYVILVDNDDIVPSYAYEKLYTRAKETDADMCIGKANFIIGNSQFEFDFREASVWDKERIINDVNEFPQLFEDVYYWNEVIKRDLLIKNNIKLPTNTVYADRYFSHTTYTYAKKIAIITDCVYLWRQVKSSLSHGRFNTDNYIDRLDSFDLDLDYLLNHSGKYFKHFLRRFVIPVKGILDSHEFEELIFNRVRPLIKNQENKFEDLYDNDLNLIDNLYAYLIANNHRSELKQLLQLDLKHQREVYDEDGVSYWNLPLFRNPDVQIPDRLFKIKFLTNHFVNIDELNVTDDKISFSNIQIPKYLEFEKLQIVFGGVTGSDGILADNAYAFDLTTVNNDDVSYNLEISLSDLPRFEFYDVFLKVVYKDEKSNKVRLNEISFNDINSNTDNMKPYVTPFGNLSFITQNLDNEFKIVCDDEKLKIVLNDKDQIKKDLRILIRKDATNELTYFTLNEDVGAFELEWKYFLDQRSKYSLFLTVYNDDGKIKRNIRFKDKNLDSFNEERLLTNNNCNVRIYKAKNGNIQLNSF